MAACQHMDILLLEVMYLAKDKHVFICDLTDMTLKMLSMHGGNA
jgi:hypothetical protein